MNFAEAWEILDLGDEVEVTNGQPNPGGSPESMGQRVWRSNNFTGWLAERIDGDVREMRFEFENEAGNLIGYILREDAGHSFTVA